MGPPAFFDLPWLPFYVAICFMFPPGHWLDGDFRRRRSCWLDLPDNVSSRTQSKLANESSNVRNGYASLSCATQRYPRYGYGGQGGQIWEEKNGAHRVLMCSGVGCRQSICRDFQNLPNGAAIGCSCRWCHSRHGWQCIRRDYDRCVYLDIACACPVELAIANWKGFVTARDAWRRTSDVLTATAERRLRSSSRDQAAF